jgi:hypothetical protein
MAGKNIGGANIMTPEAMRDGQIMRNFVPERRVQQKNNSLGNNRINSAESPGNLYVFMQKQAFLYVFMQAYTFSCNTTPSLYVFMGG